MKSAGADPGQEVKNPSLKEKMDKLFAENPWNMDLVEFLGSLIDQTTEADNIRSKAQSRLKP